MTDVAISSILNPTLVVIDHVTWTVHRGECWIVGGLPASGKSDLLTTSAGLMRPVAGTVRLFGSEIIGLHEEERLEIQLRVGIVFGNGGRLFNDLTVAQNLSLPLCYHRNCEMGSTDDRVRKILSAMGLSAVAERTPLWINRGLRQRVALARALVLAPELLFLDNPLAGLDPRESRWWLEFLGRLMRDDDLLEGRTLTMVACTDDLQPWSLRGQHFAYIDRKRLIPVGNRIDLSQHDNPALRELLPGDWLKR